MAAATKTGIKSGSTELGRVYRALFEVSHDVIVLTDETGHIRDVNPRGSQLTGYSNAELRRMNAPRELVVPEDSERVAQMLAEARRGHVRQYEVRWRTKDRRTNEFDVITVRLPLPGQKNAWTFCSLRDATQRKHDERELRENEKRLQQIIATLPVGLAVTDNAGDIVRINAAMKRIWGDAIVSGEERWARSKGHRHHNGKRIQPSEWASVRALNEGRTSLNELVDIETFDGLHKTVQNSAAPIRGEDRKIVGAVIVNEDVTERVRAETGLRNALEELKALSRKLVAVQETERHELSRELHDRVGQNLTALGINLEIVKSRVATEDDEVDSRLRDSRSLLEGTFAAMIDLLSELRPPMLDEMGLAAALEWYGNQFSARTGLEVSVIAGERKRRMGAQVEIALFRIAQEAMNNVAKHAHARRVEVTFTSSKGESMLSIADDGVGVDAEPDDGPRARGGFGMVTMRERSRAIGGRLEVRRRPGGGAVVIVTVPTKGRPAST